MGSGGIGLVGSGVGGPNTCMTTSAGGVGGSGGGVGGPPSPVVLCSRVSDSGSGSGSVTGLGSVSESGFGSGGGEGGVGPIGGGVPDIFIDS